MFLFNLCTIMSLEFSDSDSNVEAPVLFITKRSSVTFPPQKLHMEFPGSGHRMMPRPRALGGRMQTLNILHENNRRAPKELPGDKIDEMHHLLKAMTIMENRKHKQAPHAPLESSSDVEAQSFFPFFDLFTGETPKKTTKVINSEDKKEVPQKKVDEAVKEPIKAPVKSQTVISDVKKQLATKKSRKIFSKLGYLLFVVLVAFLAYNAGKRSESENYLRVLQPDQ